jgi:hypothetical protein
MHVQAESAGVLNFCLEISERSSFSQSVSMRYYYINHCKGDTTNPLILLTKCMGSQNCGPEFFINQKWDFIIGRRYATD